MKSLSVTNQMKAIEQYFPVVLLIMLLDMTLTFESVDEILKYKFKLSTYELLVPVLLRHPVSHVLRACELNCWRSSLYYQSKKRPE